MADTFYAQGDATISGGTPTGARGQELDLLIRNMGDTGNDFTYARKAYIRFDISTLNEPISNVELTLHVLEGLDTDPTNMNWTFHVLGLHEDQPNDWLESTLTWDNAPANDKESGLDFKASRTFNNGVPLATFIVKGIGSDGETVQLAGDADSDLASFLQADTDGLVTFLLARFTPGDLSKMVTHRFASREYVPAGGQAGDLAATLTILPEPASLALLAVATPLLMRHRRKKRTLAAKRG